MIDEKYGRGFDDTENDPRKVTIVVLENYSASMHESVSAVELGREANEALRLLLSRAQSAGIVPAAEHRALVADVKRRTRDLEALERRFRLTSAGMAELAELARKGLNA